MKVVELHQQQAIMELHQQQVIRSAIAGDPDSIAVAWGYHGKAKGVIGSYLVLADWEGNENFYWVQSAWNLKGAKMIRVDGVNIKENTWYTMKNGEIIEVE